MKREDTTDLALLKLNSNRYRFTWGLIKEILEIGPYTIAKYINRNGETLYHGWIDGKDTCHGYESLDAALVGLVAYRSEGPNSYAGAYFMRMIQKG